ncbi:Y-box-binding protein 2-like [Portunus trituberculatus]|uniref:Y-box-binding protein 2-like n=1 Tax=Portunus trituberculatus TaxID=210409 RepID=UPI001E1CCFE6|nr:Y-box-binding protein 2-like [Portunus trituberculatus]
MASPAHHPGRVKWFNVKAGYGFIQEENTGTEVFCHASGLTHPLKERPPREGDQVLLAVRMGAKGGVGRSASQHNICPFEDLWNRGDHRQLQELIPLILQHNGLPAVYIPKSALSANTRANTRLSRRGLPGAMGETEESPVAAPNIQQPATGAEAEPTGDKPRNWKETQDDKSENEQERRKIKQKSVSVRVSRCGSGLMTYAASSGG